MKNTNFKTKLFARMMLLVLLLASTLTLTACPGYGWQNSSIFCYSYDEAYEYATFHKQKFASDDCVFILFDIDNYENIETVYWAVSTEWHDAKSEFWNKGIEKETVGDFTYDKIPEDHHRFSIGCIYKMDAVLDNGEIIEDTYTIECRDCYVYEYEFQENIFDIISSHINFIDTTNLEQYVSKYRIFVENYFGMEVTITHQHEATQEELDAIVQIFIDNAVIIK